jgi:hypothetical protein
MGDSKGQKDGGKSQEYGGNSGGEKEVEGWEDHLLFRSVPTKIINSTNLLVNSVCSAYDTNTTVWKTNNIRVSNSYKSNHEGNSGNAIDMDVNVSKSSNLLKNNGMDGTGSQSNEKDYGIICVNKKNKDSIHIGGNSGSGLQLVGESQGKIMNFSNSLRVYYANVDSLSNKKAELAVVCKIYKPDIIMLNEIVPKNSRFKIHEAELRLEGYEIFTNLVKAERGVLIMVKSELDAQVFTKYECTFSESVWVEIAGKKDYILMGCVYRSPNSDQRNTEKMYQDIEVMSRTGSKMLMVGDYNHPELAWSDNYVPHASCTKGESIISMIDDCCLYQHVNKPTHIKPGCKQSTLDLCYTNRADMVLGLSYESPLGKSHHKSLVIDIAFEQDTGKKPDNYVYNYKRGDYDKMTTSIRHHDWEDLYKETTGMVTSEQVEYFWVKFKNVLYEYIEECVPKNNRNKVAKKSNPWISKDSIEKTKAKGEAYRRFMETKSDTDYNQYARIRNQASRSCQRDKKAYELELARDSKNNPKRVFRYINAKTKVRDKVANLNDGKGGVAVSDGEKANILNEYFASVFTQEDLENIPEPVIQASKQNMSELQNMVVTEEQVRKALSTINEFKSPGPDGFHPKCLKELCNVLSKPISYLFNISLTTGKVPNDWKIANVTPIFKSGPKNTPGNYRPVSLTSVLCKLLERFIRDDIILHLTQHDFLTGKQHGFVSNRSCMTNLLQAMDDWTKLLDCNNNIDVLYLDFKKAFDSVPHIRLLEKLRSLGIAGNILNWLADFLKDRKQRVVINGVTSGWKEVTSGVPQGSVIGPTLFLVFINDLQFECKNSSMLLFADDTKLYREVNNLTDWRLLTEDLNRVFEWSLKWQLHFNKTKCKVMHIGKKNNQYKYVLDKNDILSELQAVTEEKDLGVIIDDKLTFRSMIDEKTNKANSMWGMIRRNFNVENKEIARLLFSSLVRPHLEYCNSVWNPFYKIDQDKLERVQRRATKQVPGFRELDYEDRLESMKLPSLKFRRLRGDLIQMFKFTHNLYDAQLDSIKLDTRDRTRGHSFKLLKERHQQVVRSNFLVNRTVNDWNRLPEEVVQANTLNAFKNRLDKHYVKSRYTV